MSGARGWVHLLVATLAAFALAYTMAPTQAMADVSVGTISGTVYGKHLDGSTSPLAGVEVGVGRQGLPASHYTYTEADGTYTIDLPPGYYGLGVNDLDPDSTWVGLGYPHGEAGVGNTILNVTGGESLTGMDMTMTEGVRMIGQVKDTDGNVLNDGDMVQVVRQSDGMELNVQVHDSVFDSGALLPGTYTVGVEEPNAWVNNAHTWLGNAASRATATWLTWPGDPESSFHNIVLTKGAAVGPSVSGTVHYPDGSAAAGLHVVVRDDLLDLSADATTDSSGGFTIPHIRPDSRYQVYVEPPAGSAANRIYWTGDRGMTLEQAKAKKLVVEDSDLAVSLGYATGSITGAITLPAGTDPANVAVSLLSAKGKKLAEGSGTSYSFDPVPDGTYLVRASAPDVVTQTHSVTVADHAAAVENFTLVSGLSISGTITHDTADASDTATITVVDAATNKVISTSPVALTAGSTSTAYVVDGLAAGSYRLRLNYSGNDAVWYPNSPSWWYASTVSVSGDVTGTDFTLPHRQPTYLVKANVVLPAGVPTDVDVRARRVGDDTYLYSDLVGGQYQIKLTPGAYDFMVRSTGSLFPSYTQRVLVSADTTVDLTAPTGVITGQVVDQQGRPFPSYLQIYIGDQYTALQTDEAGRYELKAVPSGTLKVQIGIEPFYGSVTVQAVDGQTTTAPPLTSTLGGSISGHVVAGGKMVTVVATDDSGTVLGKASATSGYEFSALRPGNVHLRFEGDQVKTQWWKNAATADAATPITITGGEAISGINPTLEPSVQGTGTITGTVSSESKSPVLVSAVRVYDGTWKPERVDAWVDPGESYSLTVNSGSFRVQAESCDTGWVDDGSGWQCSEPDLIKYQPTPTTDLVRVNAGQSLTVDFNFHVGTFSTVAKPTITREGATLTASPGNWNPAADALSYQWLRDGVVVAGATGATYSLKNGDLGHSFVVTATGVKVGYRTAVSSSNAFVALGSFTGPAEAVTVTGTVAVGNQLCATEPVWSPRPSQITYQWTQNSAAIPGATSSCYNVAERDVDTTLSVVIGAQLDGYADATPVTWTASAKVPGQTFSVGTAKITGTAKVGQALTASPGSWSPSDGVTFSYRWFRGGESLGTAESYTLKPSDVGKTVSVEVTATKSGYSVATGSPVTSGVVAAGDLVSAKPSIEGTPKVGTKLTVIPGAWTEETTFGYSWKRSGTEVGTASTYTPTVADQGATLTVTLTGSAAGYGAASQTSDQSAAVAKGSLDAAKPTVSGDAVVGATLTATPGAGTEGATLTFQWTSNGVAITGATSLTYTVSGADAGAAIAVVVSATKEGYESDTKTSDPVNIPRLKTGAGSVSMRTSSWNVGVTVTAVPSGWPAGVSLNYQWKRNGAAIAGATAASYTLQAADQGKTLSVVVTGAIAGQEAASVDSPASGVVQAPLKKLTKGKVSVSGTAKAGKKLSVKVSKWKPSGIKYRYQWLRNGVAIGGATRSSYKVAKSDKGSKISVRVTATKTGYADIAVTSKATSKVK